MPSYFGQQTQTSGSNPGGGGTAIAEWSAGTFTCPGSGSQNIQELSCYIFGANVSLRLGVYDAGNNLIAEGTSAIVVTGAAYSWQGHMTQASVKAAGGVSPGVLVGGTAYKIAWARNANAASVTFGGTTGADNYKLADYTAGMIATLPAADGTDALAHCVRCGVDPASVGDPVGSIRPRTTVSIVP